MIALLPITGEAQQTPAAVCTPFETSHLGFDEIHFHEISRNMRQARYRAPGFRDERHSMPKAADYSA